MAARALLARSIEAECYWDQEERAALRAALAALDGDDAP